MFARPSIDSLEFAREGKVLSGEVAVQALPRLGELLFKAEGSIHYVARGLQSEGALFLLLDLDGLCHLRCQRCLGDLSYPIDISSRLQLLSGDELAQADESDEVDGIEASKNLDLIDLIEDELLLSLPFAPRHDDGVCDIASEGIERARNGFSVLAKLKDKK